MAEDPHKGTIHSVGDYVKIILTRPTLAEITEINSSNKRIIYTVEVGIGDQNIVNATGEKDPEVGGKRGKTRRRLFRKKRIT